MGLVGGSVFNGISGARNAPVGFNRRAMGGLVKLREKAPVLGGQFAAWGLCFATFDCTFAYMRQKEDSWNSIMSGGMAGAVMAARQGPKGMIPSAVAGAVILGFIEGMGYMLNRYMSQEFRPVDVTTQAPQDPAALGEAPSGSDPGYLKI